MKRVLCRIIAAVLCILMMTACGTKPEKETDSQPKNVPFTYEHDPRENPAAMEDILENPDAVYGFSPDPESPRLGSFADYDWTDPEVVAEAQKERRDWAVLRTTTGPIRRSWPKRRKSAGSIMNRWIP